MSDSTEGPPTARCPRPARLPGPLLTEVSKLRPPQNTRANGSDVPEMSRGARSLGTEEERSEKSQDPWRPGPKPGLGKGLEEDQTDGTGFLGKELFRHSAPSLHPWGPRASGHPTPPIFHT